MTSSSSSNAGGNTFKPLEVLKDVIASMIGSSACVYTGQPFDTIKVRMQCVAEDAKGGAIKCLTNTYREEVGISEL